LPTSIHALQRSEAQHHALQVGNTSFLLPCQELRTYLQNLPSTLEWGVYIKMIRPVRREEVWKRRCKVPQITTGQ